MDISINSVAVLQVEAQLKTNSLIDNICVYADAKKTHTVALIVPLKDQLQKYAEKISAGYSHMSFDELCKDDKIVEVRRKLSVVSILSLLHRLSGGL